MADQDITNTETKSLDNVGQIGGEETPPKELTKKEKFIAEAKSLGLLLLAVLVFRSMIMEPFRIPSGSMIPSLMIGDFILVNKLSYGVKVPFSDWVSDPVYLFKFDPPKRGEVVVFKYPKDPAVNYIKRIIGLPGDTIEIKSKVVYVNDAPLVSTEFEGKEIQEDMDEKFQAYNLKFFKTMTGDKNHVVQIDSDNFYRTDMEKYTVPEGSYFVMGDNRDFSYDSRFWGPVRFEEIKGRAFLVWFSLSLPIDGNPLRFRGHRIGTVIN